MFRLSNTYRNSAPSYVIAHTKVYLLKQNVQYFTLCIVSFLLNYFMESNFKKKLIIISTEQYNGKFKRENRILDTMNIL